jgi:hypothetical protein
MDMWVTRRHLLTFALTVLAGHWAFREPNKAGNRQQIVIYEGWILRADDVQPLRL